MNNTILNVGAEMFCTGSGAITINDAIYQGDPCYAVLHRKTGSADVFDHDDWILKQVIQKASKKDIWLEYAPRDKGSGFTFRFKSQGNDKSISLIKFLFAKYNSYPLNKVRDSCNIRLRDKESYVNRIMDLRSYNLFNASGFRPENIDLVSRPDYPEEQYIIVTVGNRQEILDYNEDLYNILATKSLCTIGGADKHKKRISVRVNGKSMNLAKFVLLFYQNYERYKKMNGARTRFVHNVSALADAFVGDCAHVNAICNWNNTVCNMVQMDSQLNSDMHDYITRFIREYGAFPITIRENGIDHILMEFKTHGVKQYYKLLLEEYCDFQRVLVGKESLTQNTNMNMVFPHENAVYMQGIDTPEQAYKAGKAAGQEEPDRLEYFWEWCDRRDALLELYEYKPEIFRHWEAIGKEGIPMLDGMPQLMQTISALMGTKFGLKNAGCGITSIERLEVEN